MLQSIDGNIFELKFNFKFKAVLGRKLSNVVVQRQVRIPAELENFSSDLCDEFVDASASLSYLDPRLARKRFFGEQEVERVTQTDQILRDSIVKLLGDSNSLRRRHLHCGLL